jgi:hypothetical protein
MIIINLKKIRDNITTTIKHNRAGHTQNNTNKEKQIDQGKQQNILTKHACGTSYSTVQRILFATERPRHVALRRKLHCQVGIYIIVS